MSADTQEEYALLVFPLPKALVLPASVSSAEAEVIRLVCEGLSNDEIAKRRATTVRTAANQLQSIYRKLRVSGRVELVRFLAVDAEKTRKVGETVVPPSEERPARTWSEDAKRGEGGVW